MSVQIYAEDVVGVYDRMAAAGEGLLQEVHQHIQSKLSLEEEEDGGEH
ncbi:MAG: hypothetical protein P4M11_07620 [Candidatus Pacebacteria bacterium]|nr:hypothetical protein [Candidatus Paceibacterota bacterium]